MDISLPTSASTWSLDIVFAAQPRNLTTTNTALVVVCNLVPYKCTVSTGLWWGIKQTPVSQLTIQFTATFAPTVATAPNIVSLTLNSQIICKKGNYILLKA
jgi:hypothetical protein